MVCCTPPASRGGGGVSLGCQSPYTYSYIHTRVHTHVHTRTGIRLETWLRRVCTHPVTHLRAHTCTGTYTPGKACTRVTQANVETGPVTCRAPVTQRPTGARPPPKETGFRPGHAGSRAQRLGRTSGNPTWGGPHAGRGCLTSPGPAEEPTQQLLGCSAPRRLCPAPGAPTPTRGPGTEFCAPGSSFPCNKTSPRRIASPREQVCGSSRLLRLPNSSQ